VTIYASDPERAPDADFVPGELALVVAGNRGRLLMTSLETPALNAPYRQAEAVLVADPWNRAF
jgi:hypothetical protein